MENAHQVIWATLYSINSIHITVVCSAYMVGARMKKKKIMGDRTHAWSFARAKNTTLVHYTWSFSSIHHEVANQTNFHSRFRVKKGLGTSKFTLIYRWPLVEVPPLWRHEDCRRNKGFSAEKKMLLFRKASNSSVLFSSRPMKRGFICLKCSFTSLNWSWHFRCCALYT